jgi:hypothetical protein
VMGNDISRPTCFKLGQNFPNPFNPITTIPYSIPDREHVILKVYNLEGEQVATLVDGTQECGDHIACFDGSGLPSGIYYYRLSAATVSDVKS